MSLLISLNDSPKCPQVDIDVRHLLRIPEDFKINEEVEDEFECLNLDVTVPANVPSGQKLPVLIWIYGELQINGRCCSARCLFDWIGGSQAITFCSAASGICGKSLSASNRRDESLCAQ